MTKKIQTNSKVFREQVRKTIKEGLCTDYTTDLFEQLLNFKNEFHNWYGEYEQHHYPVRQEAFKEFALCLPSVFDFEYTWHGYHETLKKWFEDAGGTYEERKPEKEQQLYYYLIYVNMMKMMEEEGIDLWA